MKTRPRQPLSRCAVVDLSKMLSKPGRCRPPLVCGHTVKTVQLGYLYDAISGAPSHQPGWFKRHSRLCKKVPQVANEVARASPNNSCKISDTLLAGMFIMGLDDSWESFVTSFNLHSPIAGNNILLLVRFNIVVQAAAEAEHRQSAFYG